MNKHFYLKLATILTLGGFILSTPLLSAEKFKFVPNYDESKVPQYKLPDALAKADGKFATTAVEWNRESRPQILSTFVKEIYGARPKAPAKMSWEVVEQAKVFDGAGVRKQIKLTVSDKDGEHSFMILLYEPANASAKNPTPVFVGLNFKGNHATIEDPAIILSEKWMRGLPKNVADNSTRGAAKTRWPFEEIVKRGYAVATACYCEIYPDYEKKDGTAESIYTIFDKNAKELPAIAAWSWGMSRIIDVLGGLEEIDSSKIATVGHSRLGKTSLYTGVCDPRVAIVISNDSGCMGAALSRRMYGETPQRIATAFPFWFSKNLNKYIKNPDTMPIDQHQLLALVAPRPLYVASATDDKWADPKGELTALIEAGIVYKLFGAEKIPTMADLVPEKPFHGDVGYHLRIGKHDITIYDWTNYCDFADKHFLRTAKK